MAEAFERMRDSGEIRGVVAFDEEPLQEAWQLMAGLASQNVRSVQVRLEFNSEGADSMDGAVDAAVAPQRSVYEDYDVAREPSLHMPRRAQQEPDEAQCNEAECNEVEAECEPVCNPAQTDGGFTEEGFRAGETVVYFASKQSSYVSHSTKRSVPSKQSKQSSKPPPKPKPSRLGRCRALCKACWANRCCRICCKGSGALCGLLMLAVAVCLGLFWPRDLSWKLTTLDVDTEQLMALATAVSGPEAQHMAPTFLTLKAEVDLFNPNLLGAKSGPGRIKIRHGGSLVGQGAVEPATVPPQASGLLAADLIFRFQPSFLSAIAEEVAEERWTVPLSLEATAEVDILSLLLQYRMSCDVQLSLSDLMMLETRSRAVAGQECRYSYR